MIYTEGDKSKAYCSFCKRIVTITYKTDTLQFGKHLIPNILVEICDMCGKQTGIPHQEVIKIKEYRSKNGHTNSL